MSEIVTRKFDDLAENKSGFTNPREKYDLNKIKELASDIKERGLIYPLQVWETQFEGKDVCVVVGGERRRRAIGVLIESGDWPKGRPIDCRIVKAANLKEAHYEALSDNLHREELTSFELAKEIAALKIMGDSQKSIGSRLNKSETWVSRKLKAYEAASPALLVAWKAGKLPDDTVEDLASLEEDAQEEAVEVQLKLRERGTAAAKTKAKKTSKSKAKKLARVSAKELNGILLYTEKAPKDNLYIKGIHDALRFALGVIEEDKLGTEFRSFKKALDKELASKAAEDEEKEEKAKKKAKNGHAEAAA